MGAEKRKNSIVGRVNSSTFFLTVILLVCMLTNLVLMYLSTQRYNQFVSSLETVTTIKPIVCEQVSEEVWAVVAGRKDFRDCHAYQMLDSVNATLDTMLESSAGHSELELIVARRTMDTMRSYIERIERNMANEVKIDESQEIVNVVRDVGSLIQDMLERYTAEEIKLEAVNNRRVHFAVVMAGVLEAALVFVVLLMFFSMRKSLARYIRTNIEHLECFAGMLASGKLTARVPSAEVKELSNLANCLNVMADRLQSLLEQNVREQQNLKKSELRTLQAQINPHFLYNTLDAIMWQAEAGHNDEVVHLACALSDFFRISLSSGEDWILISQEVTHLEGYLAIQKTRYRDILDYRIDIDPKLFEGYILKLLLQPLVENALYHGIKFKRGGGQIVVTGRLEGDMLTFSVQDTGKGMSAEQLQQIRTSLEQNDVDLNDGNKTGSGFGLKNVNMRIRLYYGQPVGLMIDSDENGTCVRFCVPVMAKGGKPECTKCS